MGVFNRLRKETDAQAIDVHAFAGKVFSLLVDPGGTGKGRARIEGEENLDRSDKDDLDVIIAVYQSKTSAVARLEYALSVKCVLEMVQEIYRTDDVSKRQGHKMSINDLRELLELDPV